MCFRNPAPSRAWVQRSPPDRGAEFRCARLQVKRAAHRRHQLLVFFPFSLCSRQSFLVTASGRHIAQVTKGASRLPPVALYSSLSQGRYCSRPTMAMSETIVQCRILFIVPPWLSLTNSSTRRARGCVRSQWGGKPAGVAGPIERHDRSMKPNLCLIGDGQADNGGQ